MILLRKPTFLCQMSAPSHHKRQTICSSRAPYREGKRPKAVKVYTVNQESKYLLVQGVPAVGASQELLKLMAVHGVIMEYRILDDYPAEHFTEVYLIKFERIQAARIAKRKLDDWSFYGGVLHVCYAPEYENVQDTREKLQDRRKAIAAKVRQYEKDGTYSTPSTSISESTTTSHRLSEMSSGQNEAQGHASKIHTETRQIMNIEKETHHSAPMNANLDIGTDLGTMGDKTKDKVDQYNTQIYQYPAPTPDFSEREPVPDFSEREPVPDYSEREPVPDFSEREPVTDFSEREQVFLSTTAGYGHFQDPNASINQFSSPVSNTDNYHVEVTATQLQGKFSDIYQWNTGNVPSTSKNMEQSENHDNGVKEDDNLKLPLPPKQVLHGMSRHNRRLHNYEFAHVPTAQAEFPVDYDARIGPNKSEKGIDLEDKVGDRFDQQKSNDSRIHVNDSKDSVVDEKETKPNKTMQEQIEENLKHRKDLVIKPLEKSRPTPKFIPRQAQIKKTHTDSKDVKPAKEKNTENDQLNKEIKRNAFKLGNPQGPVGPNSELVKEVKETEKSLDKTVKDIRKRMMQLSENQEVLSKKKRPT